MKNRIENFLENLKGYKEWAIVVLMFSALCYGGYYFGFIGDKPVQKQTKEKKTVDYGSTTNIQLAWNYNKRLIKAQLKAPSTAKFPSFLNAPDHVTHLGGKRYKIKSWVDAQNSFGATIRQHYVSIIRMGDSDSHWILEEVQFF